MSTVPVTSPSVSRRRVLIGGAALALLSATAAGCNAPAPRPEIDGLVTQLDRARADSELAAGAATAARPEIAATLNTVAAERSAHAQALSDEITRISGDAPPSASASSSASSEPTSTGTSAEPLPPPTAQDVIAALKQSADGAGQLAAQQSGYAAGLLGSIAASCTAAFSVALGGGKS
ncbi:hypothetical protein [Mycobacterium sp. URHB0044]|jgi:hypothetical protein|uniref:hypothetical protein n=1 Tax=Mycobacterium sp. URHB0044 TaxID=1380386 RepID=UPI00048D987C|nr:hypothetical protein [Mycobacterium sp. URHB0044]